LYRIRECTNPKGYEVRVTNVKKEEVIEKEEYFDSWGESEKSLLASGEHGEISKEEFDSFFNKG